MNFDVYFAFQNQKGVWCPGVLPKEKDVESLYAITRTEGIEALCKQYQEGNAEAKRQLPAVCWTGKNQGKRRMAETMLPTQFVMIDIDHVENPEEVWRQMDQKHIIEDLKCAVVHITPSGKGLRMVFRAIWDIHSLSEYMKALNEELHLDKLGDFDDKVKDMGRLSFLVPSSYILYWDEYLLSGVYDERLPHPIETGNPLEQPKAVEGQIFENHETITFSDEEKQEFDAFTYRGFDMKVIIEKYVKVNGEPTKGEIHNYYNEMVKNFRCIMDNNKRLLLYLLPRFGHSIDECWSQINSICRVNTLSRLPKPFYFFLKDNGFYTPKGSQQDSLKEFMLDDKKDEEVKIPFLPPVFRELVGNAPKDFVIPAVNALLPILGTLTSYLRSIYPYDGREHSTSFFSVIYAPPGTGKGFVERFLDLLFEEIKIRDFVQSERENVYLRLMNRKGDNERSPDMPHVSLRIIPPKNSEAEFLQKQRDNHGFHMFTYAAEMDSWAKGVRAAGGNKDDMIRIAWDNGEYGQQFKSFSTFKGTVRLYWNVLITGTIAQVDSYFKNVENGLVTRCSFTSIDNQEFSEAPVWKALTKRGQQVIKKFCERCDSRTYETPCNIMPEELAMVSDDDFDKEVDWKFKFREKQMVDMSWIMPTIEKFHKEQIEKAALDIDRARDVFRRRVGVRGFRLALLCYGLWDKPRQKDLEGVIKFVDWWMHEDLSSMLKLWGAKYNEQTDVVQKVVQRTVFDALGVTFSRNDVYDVCMKQGIKTPIRRILFDWKKLNYIEQLDKENFKKKNG